MTLRRDALLRKARAGRLEARSAFHYRDGEPYEAPDPTWRPVCIIATHDDFRDGWYHLRAGDFTTKSGAAYAVASADGRELITLRVHSNAVHYLREVVPSS